MSNNIILISILFSQIIYINSISKNINKYNELLNWAKNNSMYINEKIEIKFITENNHSYFSKELIEANETIMEIPYEIMINLNKTLELFNSKKLKLKFSNFTKKKLKNSKFNNFREEQSFLSFLMYISDKTKKNKFYKKYKNILNNFEINLESNPLFYRLDQQALLQNTSFVRLLNLAYSDYYEEFEIFKNEIFTKNKKIDFEEFLRYRVLTTGKSLNISGHSTIVPFFDLYEKNPIKYNVDFIYNGNNIKLFSTQKINKGNKLIVKAIKIPNDYNLIYNGITYEEYINYVPTFYLPTVNKWFLEMNNINKEKMNFFSEPCELSKNKFFIQIMNKYSLLLQELGDKFKNSNPYELLVQNLKMYRNDLNSITNNLIYDLFIKQNDIDNIKRILKTEKNILDNKINEVNNYINLLNSLDNL